MPLQIANLTSLHPKTAPRLQEVTAFLLTSSYAYDVWLLLSRVMKMQFTA